MRALILGGTQFLGIHLTNSLLAAGFNVTHFNRGSRQASEKVTTIKGDRYQDIKKLKESFDVVIDTSGYFPQNMNDICSHLLDKTQHYIFISSASVYDYTNKDINVLNEESPLVSLDVDEQKDDPATYGARKYLCESVVTKFFPRHSLIIRPGLIVGPYDPTYRFPYWADRISEGGDVLAPGDPLAPLQFIDARDLAEWISYGVQQKLTGNFNTVSPHNQLTIGHFLDEVKQAINPSVHFHWMSEEKLKEANVSCWTQLPLWVYEDINLFLKVDSSRAIAKGLTFRSLQETIVDMHEWSKGIYKKEFITKTLSRDQEKRLLENYHR